MFKGIHNLGGCKVLFCWTYLQDNEAVQGAIGVHVLLQIIHINTFMVCFKYLKSDPQSFEIMVLYDVSIDRFVKIINSSITNLMFLPVFLS